MCCTLLRPCQICSLDGVVRWARCFHLGPETLPERPKRDHTSPPQQYILRARWIRPLGNELLGSEMLTNMLSGDQQVHAHKYPSDRAEGRSRHPLEQYHQASHTTTPPFPLNTSHRKNSIHIQPQPKSLPPCPPHPTPPSPSSAPAPWPSPSPTSSKTTTSPSPSTKPHLPSARKAARSICTRLPGS